MSGCERMGCKFYLKSQKRDLMVCCDPCPLYNDCCRYNDYWQTPEGQQKAEEFFRQHPEWSDAAKSETPLNPDNPDEGATTSPKDKETVDDIIREMETDTVAGHFSIRVVLADRLKTALAREREQRK